MPEISDIDHPRFARMYMRCAGRADQRGAGEHRRRLLEGLRGAVVEIGAGHGVNFRYYPSAVSEVVAIEPEPTLRAAAAKAAAEAPVAVRVIAGAADHLPLADESVDVAVTSLVLCSVADQGRALVELRRVLRPGGELRFYEHVLGGSAPKRLMLRALDHSSLWPRLAGGCHPARDTAAAIERSGFQIASCEQFMFRSGLFEPAIPHILGLAHRLD
jgi:ubiquinone/menaquinone biosynthesis C-methylase UbiE